MTRCDQTNDSELAEIEQQLHQMNPEAPIAKSVHEPQSINLADGQTMNLEKLKGKRVFAFCGIGNPDAFLRTLQGLGAELVGSRTFNDHYNYTNACLDGICEQARRLDADLILTSLKDWTKLKTLSPAGNDIPIGYLTVEIRLINGLDTLRSLIERTIAVRIADK